MGDEPRTVTMRVKGRAADQPGVTITSLYGLHVDYEWTPAELDALQRQVHSDLRATGVLTDRLEWWCGP